MGRALAGADNRKKSIKSSGACRFDSCSGELNP